jgi:hypothetical protein
MIGSMPLARTQAIAICPAGRPVSPEIDSTSSSVAVFR